MTDQTIDSFLSVWADAERTGDAAALDGLLTDDFVGIGPLGFSLPKPAWLARHRPGELTYDSFSLDEVQTRVHGNAALVTARQNARGAYQGHPTPEAVRATLALVDDRDGWRLAGIHMSFIAGTTGAPPIPGGGPAASKAGQENR
jgi:ketosteroid isomerase-like protein